jgi:hypothetical protein
MANKRARNVLRRAELSIDPSDGASDEVDEDELEEEPKKEKKKKYKRTS